MDIQKDKKTKENIKGKRKRAGWEDSFLENLLEAEF